MVIVSKCWEIIFGPSRPHSALRIDVRTLQRLARALPVTRDLGADPGIGRAQSVNKHGRRRPVEPLANKTIIRVAAPNARWAIHVALGDFLTRNTRDEIH